MRGAAAAAAALPGRPQGDAEPVTVRTVDELLRAAGAARPGTTIRLAPGEYRGGIHLNGLKGAPSHPIVLAAADAKRPPVIRGGNSGLQLSRVAHVELRDLILEGASGNGLNIDDGSDYTAPSHHVVLRRLIVRDVAAGRPGNFDGIKLSGLDDFRVEECVVERWGVGGQGIDMVGCHRGVIERCTLRQGEEERSAGVQTKGGTREVVIRRCRFERAGGRAVNVGGSTGLEFFRPPLASWPGSERWEAKDIRVEENTFLGSGAPVAFVGVDGAVVRGNTLYRPRRWALRILQETRAPGFVPCRRGVFENNVVVFRSGEWASGGVNIGPGTAPETFTFAGNRWYCEDAPERSRPRLPVPEKNGVYGEKPSLPPDLTRGGSL